MGQSTSLAFGSDWKSLQARLRKAGDGKAIRLAMNKRIREIAKPIEAELKTAVLSVEVKGTRGGGRKARAAHRLAGGKSQAGAAAKRARAGSGLRATVSRSIQTKITNSGPRAGVRIRVESSKLPDSQKRLPMYLDGQGRWRKPTFGHGPWTTQYGTPWFTPVIARRKASARAAMAEIIDDVKKELDL